MRVIIEGQAAAVEVREYQSNGQTKSVADVHVGKAPYFDKVSMPLDLAPQVGDKVAYLANVRVKSGNSKRTGEPYAFLDVWCVERLDAQKPLTAVKAS